MGFGIEFADGFDLVAEEVDADGAVGFGRVDVENAAATGELAGHFDEVNQGVADTGKVLGEHADIDFFAALESQRQAGVVAARKEAQGDCLDGGDEDGSRAGDKFPEDCGALLLNIGVGREVFEGQHVVRGQAQNALGVDCSSQVAAGAQS